MGQQENLCLDDNYPLVIGLDFAQKPQLGRWRDRWRNLLKMKDGSIIFLWIIIQKASLPPSSCYRLIERPILFLTSWAHHYSSAEICHFLSAAVGQRPTDSLSCCSSLFPSFFKERFTSEKKIGLAEFRIGFILHESQVCCHLNYNDFVK